MVALGMTPMDAIVASTSAAAALIGIGDRVGAIEPGRLADCILVRGNPLSNIALLRDRDRIVGVMQAGRWVAGPLAEG
jgi:imidazolonepropionase-like amidohydrolase